MKKFLLLLASAVSVVLFAVSCKKEKAESVFVAMNSDSEFVDSKATLYFILSQAAPSDITISLAVLSSASEGNSAVAADKLTVPASVVISAGSSSLAQEVVLAEDATGSEAVIAVTGIAGATLQGEGVARIKTGKSYNGGGQGGEGGQGGQGGEGGLTLSLQSNWSVSLDNIEFDIDGEGDVLYYVDVVAPGSTYIWVDSYTDAELVEYYKGSVEAMIQDYSEQIKASIAKGYAANEVLYSSEDGYASVYYYDPGPTKFYIMDFDAQGNPTGKYGVCEGTVPEYEEGGEGGEGGEDYSYDQFSVSGIGTANVNFNLYEKGAITEENLEDKMIAIGQEVVDDYELYAVLVALSGGGDDDVTLSDFTYSSAYPTKMFELLDKGKYDVLIVGINEDGNLTGEYNICEVEVDAHELAEILSVRRKASRNHSKAVLRAGEDLDGDSDITVTIVGDLKKMADWKVVYDGRHTAEEGGEGGGGEGGEGDIQLLGPLTFQSTWKASYSGNGRIDVTGVTDEHFMFDIYDDVIPQSQLADALIEMVEYNFSEYGFFLYEGPDDSETWKDLDNGTYYVYIAGCDEDGNLTGNYGYNTITVGSGGGISGGGEDMVSAPRHFRGQMRPAKRQPHHRALRPHHRKALRWSR